jgi:hypothetical protein
MLTTTEWMLIALLACGIAIPFVMLAQLRGGSDDKR